MIRLAVALGTAVAYIAVKVAVRSVVEETAMSLHGVSTGGLVIVIVVLVVMGGVWGLLWWLNRWLDRRR